MKGTIDTSPYAKLFNDSVKAVEESATLLGTSPATSLALVAVATAIAYGADRIAAPLQAIADAMIAKAVEDREDAERGVRR